MNEQKPNIIPAKPNHPERPISPPQVPRRIEEKPESPTKEVPNKFPREVPDKKTDK